MVELIDSLSPCPRLSILNIQRIIHLCATNEYSINLHIPWDLPVLSLVLINIDAFYPILDIAHFFQTYIISSPPCCKIWVHKITDAHIINHWYWFFLNGMFTLTEIWHFDRMTGAALNFDLLVKFPLYNSCFFGVSCINVPICLVLHCKSLDIEPVWNNVCFLGWHKLSLYSICSCGRHRYLVDHIYIFLFKG